MSANLNTLSINAGPLTAADLMTAREAHPPADWSQMLTAAVAANLAHPAMSGADPLTECLAEQCLCFSRPTAGPNVIPVGRAARWWQAIKRWF